MYLIFNEMDKYNVNEKHMRLLSCLRNNSREKLTNISKETGIPISTLFDLLKELQESLILKNTVLVDFSKLGYNTRAYIFIKVKKEQKKEVQKHLALCLGVNSAYKLNNGWDFVLETIHKNVRELDSLLDNLDSRFEIENKKIHYLLDTVSEENFCM